MVSNYSDAGQERWLADRGIDLLRGSGPAGRHRRRSKSRVSATPPSTSSWPPARIRSCPPIPGLRELEGVWGTREATSMKAVPRRLLVLGGGSAGVELAQVVRRLGGEAVLVEGADRVLPREPAPLGKALGEALRRDGIELHAGDARQRRAAGRRRVRPAVRGGDGAAGRPAARGHRPAPARRGHRPRDGRRRGRPPRIQVDEYLRAGERLWAIGDVTGIWPLTHVGEYEGDVVAANIAGESHPANYEAVPRVTYTDPQAAAVGAVEAPYSATAPVSEVPKTATYTHAYAEANGFLTLLSDGERLTGAYALGPEAGEWLQQATLAIRAHVPLDVLGDTIQPFPSFSGIYDAAVMALRMEIADKPRPITPMDAQMAACRDPSASRELLGQTVVLIGGSAGIGLETARRARAEGADVVLTGRDPERLEQAARDVDARSTAAFDATDAAR